MMNLAADLNFENVFVQPINADWLEERNITLDVLRLDLIHPIISGNKYFKLKYYLKDAAEKNFHTIVTYGGAYSNHIIATAFACKQNGFKCIGIIRGEEPEQLSHTLRHAKELEMHLHFVNRIEYKNINNHKKKFDNAYFINEGGYGLEGVQGAAEIIKHVKNFDQYTIVFCAVGTGTTLAGIINASSLHQTIIGISVMKNNHSLEQQVSHILDANKQNKQFKIIHDYHFGGYAKYNKALLNFMNETWLQHNLPTDFVYTAKVFFGIKDMINQQQISNNSHILKIHTGGLQGNLSLLKGALQFS